RNEAGMAPTGVEITTMVASATASAADRATSVTAPRSRARRSMAGSASKPTTRSTRPPARLAIPSEPPISPVPRTASVSGPGGGPDAPRAVIRATPRPPAEVRSETPGIRFLGAVTVPPRQSAHREAPLRSRGWIQHLGRMSFRQVGAKLAGVTEVDVAERLLVTIRVDVHQHPDAAADGPVHVQLPRAEQRDVRH